MDDAIFTRTGKPAPLRLTVNGHALLPACSFPGRIEGLVERMGQCTSGELAEESVQCGLAGCLIVGKAQVTTEVARLVGSPFRHGKDGGVGTENGGDGKSQHCWRG